MDEKEVSKYLKIIDELQKAKVGNSKDIENIRVKLVNDREIKEEHVDYLTSSHSEISIKEVRKELTVTTTEAIQGKTVDEYLGIVSGHAVMGMNLISDMIGGLRDVIGGRSAKLESYFLKARELALDEMVDEAVSKGANAVLAVRFNDVSMEGKGRQMALVSVHGTAVKVS